MPSDAPPPFWNVVSLALPILTIVTALITICNPKNGDYAKALGEGLLLVLFLAGTGLLGELAAIRSLWLGERMVWLTFTGIAVNGVCLLLSLPLVLRVITDR